MDDHVDHSMLKQIFCTLESFRKLLPNRLFNDALSGETDERARLRDLDVPQHGVTGRHAAGGGIGQYDNIGQAGLAQLRKRNRRPGHLHKRENPSCIRAPPAAVNRM